MIKERIEKLRKLMKDHQIQAYLIPSTDPHQNEYLPAMWERRRWLSGFTGSAGDVVITLNKAGLWTDSRYFLQADEQLRGSGIELFKSGQPKVPTVQEWLIEEMNAGDTVGLDPRLFSYNDSQKIRAQLNTWKINLKLIEQNLVDGIWEDRPEFPPAPVEVHPEKYAGESLESKLKRLREYMADEECKVHVLTTLDTIAWLFNIRGADIDYNPVAISYAIVAEGDAYLFLNSGKVTDKLRKHLEPLVEILDYDEFGDALAKISGEKIRVWLDPLTASLWVADALKGECKVFWKPSPVTHFKSIKNETEISGLKNAHLRDGVAMVKFLSWLEKAVKKGGVTEISAAEKLESFRAKDDLFRGPSFATIAGYREHGAIVHYSASRESDIELKPEGIFLIDSGGQYPDGTTDITRTVCLGKPTDEQKDRFTRVLKGHIQLAMTRFPQNTAGNQLDTIARKPLWDIGLNYGHGTGHGVGFYLNVHEGPQAISYYRGIGVELKPGMIISNEPGFYKTGEYGIRLENLVLVQEDEEFSNEESKFYRFKSLTLCPIDLKLLKKELLSEEEVRFLDDYHATVRDSLSPLLDNESVTWLSQATRPI
ncbi:MAG: aminopeptidase P family protein [Calditrichia bacterium]